MVMRALDRKLLRDLVTMRGQVLAIGLVMVAGVTTYVAMSSIIETLSSTLERYYAEYHFADGFAAVTRAPERVVDQLRQVPGMNTVQSRLSASVNIEIENFAEPVRGTIYSLPPGGQPELNRLFIREGRLVSAHRQDEVMLNEVFAEAHGLRPDDEFEAIINGRRRTLRVAGIALSPEFIMQVEPGALFPDAERYGIMWMDREVLSAAYDMQGAFNEIAFSIAPDARIDDVVAHVDVILSRYGGPGAIARADQSSHAMLQEEFNQLEALSAMLPTIVLAVAAFLLHIVVTRLIALQREQVAVLKAFGYTNAAIGWHFVKFVLLIGAIGSVGGIVMGAWLGGSMADLYLDYFRFPYLEYRVSPGVMATATLLTSGASMIGVWSAVRRAVKLAPAEAMRPAPPASYRPTIVERIGLGGLFDQPTRIIMRNIERQPVKSGLTVLGMAGAGAIIILGSFSQGSLDEMIRVQYGLVQRDDYTVTFQQPTSTAALYELKSLPGVLHAEPFRTAAVKLRHGHREYTTQIQGIVPDSYLLRIIGTDLNPIRVPPEGLVLAERLAQNLDVQAGDFVDVEFLDGNRRERRVPVAAVTTQYIGLGTYMEMSGLNRLMGEGRAISGAFLLTDSLQEAALNDALRERPRVAGSASQIRVLRSFLDGAASTIRIYTWFLSFFAGIIAFGVVYNSARISLSERDRELASMRVLGFTRGEVSYILLGELAVLTLISIPLGMILGVWLTQLTIDNIQMDMYQLPFNITRDAFAQSALVVLVSAAVSAVIIRRRLNRLDLVGVLKTRE